MAASFSSRLHAMTGYELVVCWEDGDEDVVFFGPRHDVEWLLVNVVSVACEWHGRRVTRARMRPSRLLFGVVDETA